MPKTGLVLASMVGGAAVGLTAITVPFVSPAFRRFCLPYIPATPNQITNVLSAVHACNVADVSHPLSFVDLGSGDGRVEKSDKRAGGLMMMMPLGQSSHKVAEKQRTKTLNQLKFVYQEFYLSLTLLQRYQVMNRTGFRKILKKHDKLYGNKRGNEYYTSKVDKSSFVQDKEIEPLIERTEKIVIEKIEKGDRQAAMKRLRVPPLSEQQSAWTTFRLGFFLGCFVILCIIIAALLTNENLQRPREPKWVGVRLFRGFLILFANIWFMGANVYGWQTHGVNHVLIFEIDPRNHLTYQSLMEVASLFCVFWALCVLGYLYVPVMSTHISPFIFPLILMAFCCVWLFQPIKSPDSMMHRTSRYWFTKHCFQCFTAPFHRVTFADFWLGDQMNSLVTFFLDMEYFVCFYALEFNWYDLMPYELETDDDIYTNFTMSPLRTSSFGERSKFGVDFATGKDMCFSNVWGVRPLVSLIPATVRFLQCLRRYRDTGLVHPHLVNAGKYSTSYFVVAFGVLNSYYKTAHTTDQSNLHSPFFYFWVASYIISFTYTFMWDVWMDWSLMDPRSTTWLLRDELIYGSKWFYYAAIANDFVLRLGWVLNVSLGDVWNEHADVMLCVTSLLECWRRFVWNYLRLENEHINNCGQFRAVRDISLKPIKKGDLEMLLDRMDDEDGVTHRGKQLENRLNQDSAGAAALMLRKRRAQQMQQRAAAASSTVSPRKVSMGNRLASMFQLSRAGGGVRNVPPTSSSSGEQPSTLKPTKTSPERLNETDGTEMNLLPPLTDSTGQPVSYSSDRMGPTQSDEDDDDAGLFLPKE